MLRGFEISRGGDGGPLKRYEVPILIAQGRGFFSRAATKSLQGWPRKSSPLKDLNGQGGDLNRRPRTTSCATFYAKRAKRAKAPNASPPSRTDATGPICRGGTHNPREPRGFTSPLLAGMILVGTRTTKTQGKEGKERSRLKEDGRGGSPAPIKPAPHRDTGNLSRDLRGAADARAARF